MEGFFGLMVIAIALAYGILPALNRIAAVMEWEVEYKRDRERAIKRKP